MVADSQEGAQAFSDESAGAVGGDKNALTLPAACICREDSANG